MCYFIQTFNVVLNLYSRWISIAISFSLQFHFVLTVFHHSPCFMYHLYSLQVKFYSFAMMMMIFCACTQILCIFLHKIISWTRQLRCCLLLCMFRIRWYSDTLSVHWYTSFVSDFDTRLPRMFMWLLVIPFAFFVIHTVWHFHLFSLQPTVVINTVLCVLSRDISVAEIITKMEIYGLSSQETETKIMHICETKIK